MSNRLIIFHHIKLMSDSFYLWTQRHKQSLDKVDTMNLKSSKFVEFEQWFKLNVHCLIQS